MVYVSTKIRDNPLDGFYFFAEDTTGIKGRLDWEDFSKKSRENVNNDEKKRPSFIAAFFYSGHA